MKWADALEKDSNNKVKVMMFHNARELKARDMKKLYNARGIRIISTVP